MLLNCLLSQVKKIKRGTFQSATWQSVKVVNGIECKKVSNGVVRLVPYSHIKGVVLRGKVNPNEVQLIDNILYYNKNTKNHLVQLATTKVKAKSKYYLNGVEVTKSDYEALVPQRNNEDIKVFRVKLDNLIKLGR